MPTRVCASRQFEAACCLYFLGSCRELTADFLFFKLKFRGFLHSFYGRCPVIRLTIQVELDYQYHNGFPNHFCKRRLTVIDNFRIARHPPRIDAKRRDHFLQADFSGLIRPVEAGYRPVSRHYAQNEVEACRPAPNKFPKGLSAQLVRRFPLLYFRRLKTLLAARIADAA
jgi:hypothetical protein